jgi:hypothetical protein
MQPLREAYCPHSRCRCELAVTESRDRQTKQDCLIGFKREHNARGGLDPWPRGSSELPVTTQATPRAMDRAGIVRKQGTYAGCSATMESIENQANGSSVMGQERSQLPEMSSCIRGVGKAERWRHVGRVLLSVLVHRTIHPLGRLLS